MFSWLGIGSPPSAAATAAAADAVAELQATASDASHTCKQAGMGLKLFTPPVFNCFPPSHAPLLLLCLADCHTIFPDIARTPACDILVVAGDFTLTGSEKEVLQFYAWATACQWRYCILVPGFCELRAGLTSQRLQELMPRVTVLQGQARSVLGVSFFGCSHLHQGGGAGDSLYSKIAAPCTAASIPPGIDVLVTHESALGLSDAAGKAHEGNSEITLLLQQRKIPLHVFGCVHRTGNSAWSSPHTFFLNAATCIGDQVGTKRRAPVVAAYIPYAFVEGPHGVRVPKFTPQQQQQQQQQLRHSTDSDASDDELDECDPAPAAAREDWLVVLAKAAPHKKEWVRRPGM